MQVWTGLAARRTCQPSEGRCLVRAKGLEPPRALAHQDLNLGRFIPSSPALSHCIRDHGRSPALEGRFVPSCPVLYQRVGLLGCSQGLATWTYTECIRCGSGAGEGVRTPICTCPPGWKCSSRPVSRVKSRAWGVVVPSSPVSYLSVRLRSGRSGSDTRACFTQSAVHRMSARETLAARERLSAHASRTGSRTAHSPRPESWFVAFRYPLTPP